MTYLLGLLLLALVGCAVTIYRLSGDKEDAYAMLREADSDRKYLRQRNDQLNRELLRYSVKTTTQGTAYTVDGENRSVVKMVLPEAHPQKRKPTVMRSNPDGSYTVRERNEAGEWIWTDYSADHKVIGYPKRKPKAIRGKRK